jgi:hypothetical protein
LFAKDWLTKRGSQSGWSQGGASSGQSTSQEMHYQVPPITFTRLLRGGPANGRIVEGVMYKAGTIFRASGANYLRIQFQQN